MLSAKINRQAILKTITHAVKEKTFLLFLLLSLVASLPVGVSHKQAFNYLMQSAPFFTLAMMFLCFKPFNVITAYCASRPSLFKMLLRMSYGVFAISLMALIIFANGYNRNKDMIKDIDYLTHYIEQDAIVSASQSIYFQWYSGAYFARYSMISLTPEVGKSYYLTLKNEVIPKGYKLVKIPLFYYDLAKRI